MIWAQFYQRDRLADGWRECTGTDQIAYLDGRRSIRNHLVRANAIGLQRFGHRHGYFGFRLFRGQRIDHGFALTAQVFPMYRESHNA